jgi:hypothetical protein
MSSEKRESKADQLRRRHEQELAALQASCPHEDLSEWMEKWNDRGPLDYDVRVCEECDKEVHIRQSCMRCQRILMDDEAKYLGEAAPGYHCAYCEQCLPSCGRKFRSTSKRSKPGSKP